MSRPPCQQLLRQMRTFVSRGLQGGSFLLFLLLELGILLILLLLILLGSLPHSLNTRVNRKGRD